MKTRISIALIATLMLACFSGLNQYDLPNQIVLQFLEWEGREHPNGVYPSIRSQELNALLSTELQCLLDAAITANNVSIRNAPDDKPPFIEGNIFLPVAWERPLNPQIMASQLDGDRSSIEVSFQYEPNGLRFTSKYWLSKETGVWKIIDISLGGDCDFCQNGNLRDALYDTLRHFPETNSSNCKKM